MNPIGKDLKKMRERYGLTMKEVADLSGFSQPYISQIENGKREPTFTTLLKITKAILSTLDFDNLTEEQKKQIIGDNEPLQIFIESLTTCDYKTPKSFSIYYKNKYEDSFSCSNLQNETNLDNITLDLSPIVDFNFKESDYFSLDGRLFSKEEHETIKTLLIGIRQKRKLKHSTLDQMKK